MDRANGLIRRLQIFMQGRYGIDRLYRALLIAWLSFTILSSIVGHFFRSPVLSLVLMGLSPAAAAWMIFRALSKDIPKRQAENDKYLVLERNARKELKLLAARIRDRKTHRYRKCTRCKTPVRLKYEKGEHTVRCPVCGESFKVRL